jgi:hypothetical protein
MKSKVCENWKAIKDQAKDSQHSKFVLHACLTKWKDILPKLWLSSLLLLRRWTETGSKPFKSGSGRCAEGLRAKWGAQLINCTVLCGAAAEKPRSCGSKQLYGGVVDRVWRLGLGLSHTQGRYRELCADERKIQPPSSIVCTYSLYLRRLEAHRGMVALLGPVSFST